MQNKKALYVARNTLESMIVHNLQNFTCWTTLCDERTLSLRYNGHFPGEPAFCFLTRTFRNVLYVRVGKLIVRLWHSQHSRTVVWGGLRRDGSWKTPTGTGATPIAAAGAGATNTPRQYANWTPELNQRPPRALFCLKLDNSWCYARYSCGSSCNAVVKLVQRVQVFKMHFTSVLRKQFAANEMFLRKANIYKQALALRNSRLG